MDSKKRNTIPQEKLGTKKNEEKNSKCKKKKKIKIVNKE